MCVTQHKPDGHDSFIMQGAGGRGQNMRSICPATRPRCCCQRRSLDCASPCAKGAADGLPGPHLQPDSGGTALAKNRVDRHTQRQPQRWRRQATTRRCRT